MAPRAMRRQTEPARQVLVTCSEAAPWIEGLGGYLRPQGVGLRQVFDGPASVRLLDREGFDLAIVGEPLPPMDGLSLLRLIHSVRRALPCVYVAREVSDHTLQAALELNAFSVVSEPVELHVVSRLVKRIYQREWNLLISGPDG